MKKKLTPAAWTKLAPALKALYKKVAGKDGAKDTYELEIEDDDDDSSDDDDDDSSDDDDSGKDTTALKNALERERNDAKKLRNDLKELRKEFNKMKKDAEAAAEDEARNNGDVTALEKSWQKKLADREAEMQAIIDQRETSLRELLVDSEAMKIATEISKSPALLLPHIKARLQAEFGDDGKATTRVLDKDGKPSASDLAGLKKEFLSNKEFSSILIGSKGSGGGSGGPGASGPGAFKLEDYKNEDGTVNWSKVHLASKDNPTIVKDVQTALNPSAAVSAES